MSLLIKKTDEHIETAFYNSSNIFGSIYNENTQQLEILFVKGNKYIYDKVKPLDYVYFREHESQGKLLHSYMKPFPTKPNGNFNVKEYTLLKESLILQQTMLNENNNKSIEKVDTMVIPEFKNEQLCSACGSLNVNDDEVCPCGNSLIK